MQMDPRGFFQKRDRFSREVNPTLNPRTANCGGESSSPLPPLRPHLLLCQAVEAAQPQDHASTITLASRDTIATMETTTTSPPAFSTLTLPHTCRHRTASALKRDVSGGDGREAPQWPSRPAAPRKEGPSLGLAPATTPQGHHSILTQW